MLLQAFKRFVSQEDKLIAFSLFIREDTVFAQQQVHMVLAFLTSLVCTCFNTELAFDLFSCSAYPCKSHLDLPRCSILNAPVWRWSISLGIVGLHPLQLVT